MILFPLAFSLFALVIWLYWWGKTGLCNVVAGVICGWVATVIALLSWIVYLIL